MAATAAERLGRAPRVGHLDRTSVHGDGRDNRDEEPGEQVVPSTRGYSREHRPDVNQVMVERMVEHQAGMPLLRKPLSGHRRDAQDVGEAVRASMHQWQTTSGLTSLVADSALSRAANRQKLAQSHMQWITRVPATVSAAPTVRAQANPQSLASRTAGYRYDEWPSSDGGMEPRWVLSDSALRQAPARRTVDQPWRQPRDQATQALKKLCRTPCACEAEARQALSTCERDVHTIDLAASTVRAQPRDRTRGRPGPDARPNQVASQIDGALASTLTSRQARIDQHGWVILATTALDPTHLPPQERLAGYQGQVHVARGFRWLKDPQFLAASRYRKTPERIMALLMVMTVCVLVSAAVESRLRQALKDHAATFPDQRGTRIQQPTARWVFHDVVGMHV